MSHDLSGLFEEKDDEKKKTRLGSKHTVKETIKKIEAAAMGVRLSVVRTNNFKMKIHPTQKMTRCSRSYYDLSAEVIEVAPTNCVVEISKSAGELTIYKEFCKSLSSLLTDKSGLSSRMQESKSVDISGNHIQEIRSSGGNNGNDDKKLRGYSSS
ncbi:hypothetical protein SLEP1_g28626 [Rubroshorea leprosula]|uniref:non-specific serine/threonine protein kinase n=1 Tax=Rubroshorea leprosula TaxID=152421 RepID=A0AAV5K3Z8_9ROSI|nr:hypothetical protein SLEP1_g28626 [Rubroshorea leprosula]